MMIDIDIDMIKKRERERDKSKKILCSEHVMCYTLKRTIC